MAGSKAFFLVSHLALSLASHDTPNRVEMDIIFLQLQAPRCWPSRLWGNPTATHTRGLRTAAAASCPTDPCGGIFGAGESPQSLASKDFASQSFKQELHSLQTK